MQIRGAGFGKFRFLNYSRYKTDLFVSNTISPEEEKSLKFIVPLDLEQAAHFDPI